MDYHDLTDTAAQKAWEVFLHAETEYKADPTSKEKAQNARKQFDAYDKLRWQIVSGTTS